MIDERHEELAALHALDLLEGEERAAFERELATNAELRLLVDQLRESSAALAHTAPDATLPAQLRARVLASADQSKIENRESKIIHPPFSVFRSVLPWAVAACLAFAAAAIGRLYLATRTEAQLLSARQALADLELQSAHNQLEAERILARQQLANLNQQVTDTARQLADANQKNFTTAEQLATTATRLAAAERQIADAQAALAQRDTALLSQTEKVAGLETERARVREQLVAMGAQVAELTNRLHTEADLANFKIATLASMLKNSPPALAVTVWNPARQEGVITLEKPPPLTADQSLELWVVEAKEGAKPVSAGVLTIGPDGTARLQFKPTAPVTTLAAFAISREKNDGAHSHAAPAEVVMLGKTH